MLANTFLKECLLYVDGFITPVPKKNLAKYRKSANLMAKVMKELGALEYVEYIADDVKRGKWTSFPRMQSPDIMPFDGKRMIYGGFKSFVEMT